MSMHESIYYMMTARIKLENNTPQSKEHAYSTFVKCLGRSLVTRLGRPGAPTVIPPGLGGAWSRLVLRSVDGLELQCRSLPPRMAP